MKIKSIFLSAPYTFLMDKKTKLLDESYKKWLEQILDYLSSKAPNIYNSHQREEWGAKIFDPQKAIETDFNEIAHSDCVVAHIGDPPSSGVLMELGFAASLNKTIIIFAAHGQPIPYLAQGLGQWTNTQYVYYYSEDDLFEQLDLLFNRLPD